MHLDPRVYYLDIGDNVQELGWNGSSWFKRDVRREAKALSAAPGSNLTGFGVGDNLHPRVYFVDTSDRVQELGWNGKKWFKRGIGGEVNAPPASPGGGLVGFGVGADLDPRVYYVDTNGHVQELGWDGKKWFRRNIGQEINAPRVEPRSRLVGFGVGDNLDPRLYYMDKKGHIQELGWNGNRWFKRDIGRDVKAPPAALGSDLTGFGVGDNLDPRVYYVNGNGHVQELGWTGSRWFKRRVGQEINAPRAALSSGLTGFGVGDNLDPRVYYMDASHDIQELGWNGRRWFKQNIGREANMP